MVMSPEVGTWYLNSDTGEMFEVVALDDEGDVEIQYFDGAINDVDLETWTALPLSAIPAPEDWSAPYEIEPDEVDESEQPAIIDEKDAIEGLIH